METETQPNRSLLTYFTDETLLKIITHLLNSSPSHNALLPLSATCTKLRSLLQDRSLSDTITFTWHHLNSSKSLLLSYLKQRDRSNLITKLHITDLYWVTSGEIRDSVVKMMSLKELLAAGTRLTWAHLKEILTSCDITSLSWSWDSALEEVIRKKGSVSPVRFSELLDLKDKFMGLKNLLLHVPIAVSSAPTDLIVCSFTSFVYLISLCRNLEQLWILSWPKTSSERKLSSSFFREVFETEDEIDLKRLSVLVVDVKEPPRIYVPRLVLKLLRNFERNGIRPKVSVAGGFRFPGMIMRLEQNYIGSTTLLLNSLSTHSPQLQRLLIHSSPNDSPLDPPSVKSLFSKCRSLAVFYAVVEPTLKSTCKKLKKYLTDEYKTERASLSVFIETSLEDDKVPGYPDVHFRQMVVNCSQVCGYSGFPGFL